MKARITWVAGIAIVLALAGVSIKQEGDRELRSRANAKLSDWLAECHPAAPAGPSGFGTINPAANAPVGPTAWQQSEALRFLEGRGPRPDIPCEQRRLLGPL